MAEALILLGWVMEEKIVPTYLCFPITCSGGNGASQVSNGAPGEPRQWSAITFFFRHGNCKGIKVPFGEGACSILWRAHNSPVLTPASPWIF